MFKRSLKLPLSRSFFLFGARSTGKSTLLKELLPESKALWLDLLNVDLEQIYSKNANVLDAFLAQESGREWVVIDEIQKVPSLLGVVHKHIREKKFKFALTGSSARKLKRGQADMLAGRASWFELYPLTHRELGAKFNLDDTLNWGSLPEIHELSEADRNRFLKSYCHVYLKEEIIAEQVVRKIQPFREFLELVALQNAQIINYAKFAKDCGVDITTIQTYFEILKDTLIGIEIPPFHESIRKRQRKNPKFYLFDLGVTKALAGLIENKLVPRTPSYGKAFEQFVILEIYRLMKYRELDWRLSYLTTKDGAEIDLLVEQGRKKRFAIEIKSTMLIDEASARSFESLAGDIPNSELLLLSNDPRSLRYGSVEALHWTNGIERLLSSE